MKSNQSSITLGIRNNKKEVEEHPVFAPKFDADGLIPAMAMDAITKEPLMLAYMNGGIHIRFQSESKITSLRQKRVV